MKPWCRRALRLQIDHVVQQSLPPAPQLRGAHAPLAALEAKVCAMPECQLSGSGVPDLAQLQQASIAMTFLPPERIMLTGTLLLSVRPTSPRILRRYATRQTRPC